MTTTRFAFDLNPSFNKFLSTLAAAQQNNETIDRMQTMVETMQTRLDEQWKTLNELSYAGMEQAVCGMLDVFVREWSGMQALALIVDLEAWVDPYDQGVQNAFWAKLTQQHAWLESRLLLPFNKGIKDRDAQSAQDGLNLVETRIKAAEHGVERQFQQNQELIQTVNNLLGQLQQQLNTTPEVVNDAHADSRASLKVAIDAVGETRQAINSFVQPAVDIMKYTGEYVQQALPVELEQAVDRVDRRKTMRRVWFVVGIGVALLAAYLFVYIGLHFLY